MVNNNKNEVENEVERFLDREEAADLMNFSVSKITVWRRKGSFPEPFKTPSGNFLGWTKSQLVEWQQSMMNRAA
jgi:predicted DNA-binding transcriptional regulator AlpA